METIVLAASRPDTLTAALALLQTAGLVAFPTDTVYGVGALVHNAQGIEQLYLVKGRETTKAIPVLLGDVTDLDKITLDIGARALRLARRFWPGPLTLVVLKNPSLPSNLSTASTVGVRMPDHPVALALLRAAGPMAVTSANLSGGDNTSTASEVLAQLGGRIPLILDGGLTPGGSPSTVVDCTTPEPVILRAGPITLEQIHMALS